MAHQAGSYPGFRSMKRLGVLLLPLDGMLVHRRVTPSSKFAGTNLYTWVERGTTRVKFLAEEHNAVPRPGLEPGPPDPESSALTIRSPRLPYTQYMYTFIYLIKLSCFCCLTPPTTMSIRCSCLCNEGFTKIKPRHYKS